MKPFSTVPVPRVVGEVNSALAPTQAPSHELALETSVESTVEPTGRKTFKGGSRASLSTSPLARPKELVHVLAGQVQDFIYFPTPDPLYLILGCVAANMMKGSPVWLVMVGAPSAGKTLIIESLGHMAFDHAPKLEPGANDGKCLHIVGAVKSTAALLSGVAKKDVVRGSTGGLLRQIGSHGMLIMKDLTSMFSIDRGDAGEVISALREVFDGRYSRPLGMEGGRVLQWLGRIGFLAACTPVIDRHAAMIGDLGERWIYWRYPETDGYGETVKALGQRDPQTMMQDLRCLMEAFFDALGLEWSVGGCESRGLDRREMDRLYAMSVLCCTARTHIPREKYDRTHEVNDLVSKESPPRIAGELGQLYLGLERIGLEEGERWRLVGQVAMDSVRQTRMRTVLLARESKKAIRERDVVERLKVGSVTAQHTLEDLCLLGVLDVVEKKSRRAGLGNVDGSEDGEQTQVKGSVGYGLSAWAGRQLELGWRWGK